MSASVIAVVAAHNPVREALEANVIRIARQCDSVVIVDDGSDLPIVLVGEMPSVTIVRQENLGIAAALNRGIVRARELAPGPSFFVATFDQDSSPEPGYVRNALEAIEAASLIGIEVGATCGESLGGRTTRATETYGDFDFALQVAQSGMVYPIETFNRIGDFDELLFIDGVDTDHALRMKAAGLPVVIAQGTTLEHSVGEPRVAMIAGHPLRVGRRVVRYSYHSGERRYYITRNRLLLLRRHWRTSLAWMVYDNVVESRTLVLALVFGPHRASQLQGFVRGMIDGLLGITGRIALTSTRRREAQTRPRREERQS